MRNPERLKRNRFDAAFSLLENFASDHNEASCAIWRVPENLALHAWVDAKPLLAAAIDRSGGRYDVASVPRLLESGEAQLFIGIDSSGPIVAALTQVVRYPASRRMVVLFCGGRKMRLWLRPGIAAIEEWARACQCDGVEIFGRKGWARALGYRKTAEILERNLQ